MARRRIDQLLVERGLAESRHKAQALLLAGKVLVDEQRVDKPGKLVGEESALRILEALPFASRAGAKLQAALDHFHISPRGRVCADLGASTGGFTDCLLQNGARLVYAFDVGRGQLAWRLRTDPRVVVKDGYNVRHLSSGDLPEGVTLITADLSFISLTKIIPPLKDAVVARWSGNPPQLDFVLLVKPQFEVGKGEVGKGGIVRDAEKRRQARESVESIAVSAGFEVAGNIVSPVPGARGNEEFLLYLKLTHDL